MRLRAIRCVVRDSTNEHPLTLGRCSQTGGIFGDETNSLSTDPLDHPLAKISPLNNPPSPPSSATARLDAAPKSPDSPSTTPKGVSSKNKTTLVSQMKGKQRRSVSVVEVDLVSQSTPRTLSTPNRRGRGLACR